MTGLEIARLHARGGHPDGVFTTIVGRRQGRRALLAQPVDGLFFTGSVATGKRIAEAVRGRLVKLQLELGGKDPIYVCEDADIEKAAAGIADGAFYNTGQSCCSVERIYVNERIFPKFVEAFVAEVRRFKRGDPADESTYIGPLTRAPQLKVLEAQVKDAVKKGAKVLAGGKRIKGKGNWFEPTVLVDVDHSMAGDARRELRPDHRLMAARKRRRGRATDERHRVRPHRRRLHPDRGRAEKILAQVRSGSVYWNCCDRVSPRLPWSGVGDSGIGLTLSTYGIETFTRPKAWHLRGA
jgi:acyl-CoA reductase-like NAD-dependent aldehyde dehydrogenase